MGGSRLFFPYNTQKTMFHFQCCSIIKLFIKAFVGRVTPLLLVDIVIIKIVLNGPFSLCTGIRRYPDCS